VRFSRRETPSCVMPRFLARRTCVIFGQAALPADREARVHRFRVRIQEVHPGLRQRDRTMLVPLFHRDHRVHRARLSLCILNRKKHSVESSIWKLKEGSHGGHGGHGGKKWLDFLSWDKRVQVS
jgi:hypothetical protein